MSNSPARTAAQALWHDRVARVSLGLAIALNLLLFALVLLAKQSLDEALAASSAGPTGGRHEALIVPIIGLVAWIVGGGLGAFYHNVRDEAPIAYIIWGAVVLIELATWVAVLNLIIDL